MGADVYWSNGMGCSAAAFSCSLYNMSSHFGQRARLFPEPGGIECEHCGEDEEERRGGQAVHRPRERLVEAY